MSSDESLILDSGAQIDFVPDGGSGVGTRKWIYRGFMLFIILASVAGLVLLIVYLSKRSKSKNTTSAYEACTLPTPPTGITLESPQPGTIVVTWPIVSSAAGYRIYRSLTQPNASGSVKTSAVEARPIYGTNNNTTTFTNLSDSTQYISVTTTNACGESVEGTVQQILMSCELTAPTNLALTQVSPGNMIATWSSISGASRYEIYIQTGTGHSVDEVPATSMSDVTYSFTGTGLISVTVNAANSCSTGPLASITGTYGQIHV